MKENGGGLVQANVSISKGPADMNGKNRCSDKSFFDRELRLAWTVAEIKVIWEMSVANCVVKHWPSLWDMIIHRGDLGKQFKEESQKEARPLYITQRPVRR